LTLPAAVALSGSTSRPPSTSGAAWVASVPDRVRFDGIGTSSLGSNE
jgi:hypothetical protein